ncbi:DUF4336 domain-containing protein [Melittangium boletus]|uniref:DUF4336 domain-containing protein n=1 Tax=Melittangium boletus DSM 14713 TaxID=1294270 RepID=A0A250IRE0_9BACT|nr:DUF4336 domain-containing protein [Melittangium boletus]ATB33820.1 hypothetical protein MEBOL_007318 [Melittangium boletus DSM 14713]
MPPPAPTPESSEALWEGAIRLYTPLDVPKPLVENVWLVDGPVVRMAAYGTHIPFPSRMTIVRLANGDLWLHSPTALSEALRRRVESLGRVAHLVSPNKIHYAHIAAWKAAYPDARAWASPGVRERAASQGIAVSFDAELGEASPPEWEAEIDQLVFRGSRFMEEVIFLHRASRTLVLADLIENFEADHVRPGLRRLARFAGSLHPDGKMPVDLRLTFLGRKAQARACLERMLAWRPERIVLAHGRCYQERGTEELRRAFRWLG